MARPAFLRPALSRAAAISLLLALAACNAEQRDLGAISGVPDVRFGGGRGNDSNSWGRMSTGGGTVVMHREIVED